jgi:hypothetical protein
MITNGLPGARGQATTVYRQAGWAVLRALVSTAVVLAVYYWLPLDHTSTGGAITILVIGLVLLIALVAWQVRRIIAHPHPRLRAVEALATTRRAVPGPIRQHLLRYGQAGPP